MNQPWVQRDEWKNGYASSNAKGQVASYWLMSGIWMILALPLMWIFPAELAKGNLWAWAIPPFALLGVYLLVAALRATLEWRRFGRLQLRLDPFPGCLGGQAGGVIDLAVSFSKRHRFRVSLACVNSYVSGSGNSRNRWQKVVWKRECAPHAEPGPQGTRLKFAFQVPEDVPETQERSQDYHKWEVQLSGEVPGVDLDRTIEIPVYKLPQPLPSQSAQPGHDEAVQEGAAEALPPKTVRVFRDGSRLRLTYPASRNRAYLGLLVFGLAFLIPVGWLGGGILSMSGSSGSGAGLFQVLGGLMTIPFALVGAFLILLSLYLVLNRLDVVIADGRIDSVRSLLGLRRSRQAELEDVQRIEMKIEGQSGQGAKAKVRHAITARLKSGGRIALGDGIEGDPAARGITRIVEDVTGLPINFVAKSRRSKLKKKQEHPARPA